MKIGLEKMSNFDSNLVLNPYLQQMVLNNITDNSAKKNNLFIKNKFNKTKLNVRLSK